jgi:hypothetical protein
MHQFSITALHFIACWCALDYAFAKSNLQMKLGLAAFPFELICMLYWCRG